MSYLTKSLILAHEAAKMGEVPIGALIVRGDAIIAQAHNLIETRQDPTAHAEILVIREACKKLGARRLSDCDLYVSLEPCPMCAQAISFARIRKLVFGAFDPKGGGVEHGPRIFQQPTCHHAPEVIGGVMEVEASALLKEFFQGARRSVL